MRFRSYYTKVIFILASVFLLLFVLLAALDGLVIERTIKETLSMAQQSRMYGIFKELYRLQQENKTAQDVQEFVNRLFLEFQLDIYDNEELWVAGNHLFYDAPGRLPDALKKIKGQVGGYAALFVSPIQDSRYKSIVISWAPKERRIFKQVIYLFLGSALLTVLVAVGVGWKLSSTLNKRLNVLQNGVAQIARGNFDVHLNIEGHDEISRLGREFNRMAGQIRDLIQQLEESNNARRRLIAHASHEMKSPITSIKGFVDIVDYMKLLDGNPQGQQLLGTVRKDVKRVVKIADDLVQLAKYQDPGFGIELEKIRLDRFLKEEHTYFQNKAKKRKAHSRLLFTGDRHPVIRADAMRLAQILDNLWSNALKYGDLSQPIVTTVSTQNGQVVISIQNHLPFGLDVSPHQLFEPFYRHPKHTKNVKGSGLGLSIVKELVDKMKGRITAEIAENRLIIHLAWQIAGE